MPAAHRRVIAETATHAQALAHNLARQDFVVEAQTIYEWLLRKRRRRGDITVTIMIRQPEDSVEPRWSPPTAVPPSPWAPPTWPPAT